MPLKDYKSLHYYKRVQQNNNNNNNNESTKYDDTYLNNKDVIQYELCKNISHRINNYYSIKSKWSYK